MEKPPKRRTAPAGKTLKRAEPAAYPRAPSRPRTLAVGEAAAPYRYVAVFQAPPHERIEAIRAGVPARRVDLLSELMSITKESLIATLGLSRATLSRKARAGQTLARDESERVLGVEALIGQVQSMVQESGNPAGFDAARWMAQWMHAPLPALGGATPASYLDTVEGQKLIGRLLAMTQSGAYA